METSARSPVVAVPAGWGAIFSNSAMIAIVGFVVLQLKELVDAGAFDTKATAVDAILIAAGVLVVSAIRKWLRV